MGKLIYFIATILLSLATIVGDVLVRKSSEQKAAWTLLLITGGIIYFFTALGWFFVFKKIKFSSAATIFSVIIILASVLIGVLYFKDKLNVYEYLGVGLAVTSVLLLYRFI